MKNKSQQLFLVSILIILIIIIAISCVKENEDSINVKMNIPVITLGVPDTLSFEISSLTSLRSIKLSEMGTEFLFLNWQNLGQNTRNFELNVIYDPKTPGKKDLVLFVEDGLESRHFAVTVNVID